MNKPNQEHDLPALLKDFRERNKWSQRETAEALGINVRSLQNWEQGRYLPKGFALTALLRLVKPSQATTNASKTQD